jgi:hypothetical protein
MIGKCRCFQFYRTVDVPRFHPIDGTREVRNLHRILVGRGEIIDDFGTSASSIGVP